MVLKLKNVILSIKGRRNVVPWTEISILINVSLGRHFMSLVCKSMSETCLGISLLIRLFLLMQQNTQFIRRTSIIKNKFRSPAQLYLFACIPCFNKTKSLFILKYDPHNHKRPFPILLWSKCTSCQPLHYQTMQQYRFKRSRPVYIFLFCTFSCSRTTIPAGIKCSSESRSRCASLAHHHSRLFLCWRFCSATLVPRARVSHSAAHHRRCVCDEAGNGVRRHVWSVTSYRATDTAGGNNRGPTSTGGRHGRGRELPLRAGFEALLRSSVSNKRRQHVNKKCLPPPPFLR